MKTKEIKLFFQKIGFAWAKWMGRQELVTVSFADFCAKWSKNCVVGDFVYPSGLITSQAQKSIQAIGIVGWVNPDPNAPIGQRGFMLCCEQEDRIWADKYEITGATDINDGWRNTQSLLKLAKEKDCSFPAAEYCVNYSGNGIKAGDGFMASKEQWLKIFANVEIINKSIERIGAELLFGWYWSSSEYVGNSHCAWVVYAANGSVNAGNKNFNGQFARCVVAF